MIPDEIRNARLRKGLTQEALAQKIGTTAKSVHRWETGKVKPSLLLGHKLEEVLAIDPRKEQDE